MRDWIVWYIVISSLGWLAFPIAYRLLPGLRDRGFAASRTLGLLIWGFIFWLLASLGALPFNQGGVLFAAALLAALALWRLRGIQPRELWDWLKEHAAPIVISEALFLALFAALAVIRAANPDAVGTEKPMELAFINAILRSPTFPPHDPWLSGYAISYYYFGYVLVSMLAKIGGTTGSVAFNLGIALTFALSASGAYGLLINLLNPPSRRSASQPPAHSFAALLGPFFVLLASNLEGFLHVLHTRGFFWQRSLDGTLNSAFWKWLDIKDLSAPPQQPFSWVPSNFWWWWRASRVLQDYDYNGTWREIIDEFPFFSFLLGDLHPHVLAMPFAFLAVTLALSLLLRPSPPRRPLRLVIAWNWVRLFVLVCLPVGLAVLGFGLWQLRASLVGLGFLLLVAGAVFLWKLIEQSSADAPSEPAPSALSIFELNIDPPFFLLAAVALGGLAFLNTWDFPVYVFIFAAAFALNRSLVHGHPFGRALVDFLWMGAALGLCGIMLYFPFYLGFSSQAGGVLPNLIYPTRGAHLWVMFAPLLTPALLFLTFLNHRLTSRQELLRGMLLSAASFLALWIFSLLLGLVVAILPNVRDIYLGSLGAPSLGALYQAALERRFSAPGAWITLLLMLGLLLSLVPQLRMMQSEAAAHSPRANQPLEALTAGARLNLSGIFSLVLILTGLLLVIAPEFVFLRDLFGWRMNTIFKFYFQAWLVWSIAAAFSVVTLSEKLRSGWKTVFQVSISLLLLASLAYPVLSLWNKTNGFKPLEWTLDSAAYSQRFFPEEAAAIAWLKQAPPGIIAEAVSETGGSYTEYARASTLSGLPAVLGWVGHEDQWRGGRAEIGDRQSDLLRLYCTRDWEEARQILEKYNIRYVFVGNLERQTYTSANLNCPIGLVEVKFMRNMLPVFTDGQAAIYEYPGSLEP